MEEKIINLYRNNNKKTNETAVIVCQKLKACGFEISLTHNPKALLNLCIGGDGAFLRAVHQSNYSQIPFVGINTGHLGFFQEILIPNIDTFIEQFINKDYFVEELDLVEMEINFHSSVKPMKRLALNEFAVRNFELKIAHLEVFVDDIHLQSFAGDALLVSTPSGSTAYNFSAGGSILYQSLKGFQLTPIAPINSKAYRSLMHSIVLSSETKLEMKQNEKDRGMDLLIVIDGTSVKYDKVKSMKFTIPKIKIKKLVFDKDWYWINVKDKFL